MKLDDQGWKELMKELEESLERVQDIAARADERLCAADEDGFPAIAAAMGIERGMAGRSRGPQLPVSL